MSVFSQTGKLFGTDQQLSSSFTNQVYLDRDGFIWAVTRNGVQRYDGYQFYLFKKELEDAPGMATNYVNCMVQDKNGLFYLGMYGALQTFDGSEFKDVEVKDQDGFVVPCYMTCFLQRKNGDLVAGTSGHGLLKIVDRGHAVQQNGPLRDIHTVNSLCEDKKGHLWIATRYYGLYEYDGKNALKYFTSDELRYTVRQLCLDLEGNLYVGTSNNGVYVRPASGGDFKHLDVTTGKQVSSLYCCRDGRLMIGYDGQGLAVYWPKTGEIENNPYYSREVDLSKSKVYSIVEDGIGNIWLGLLQKGIYMQPVETSGFEYMGYKSGGRNVIGQACVVSSIIDSKARCWVGTDKDGLYCLDVNHQPIKHFKDQLPSTIMSIAEDASGRIWVGSYGEGLGYIDAGLQGYHPFSQYTKSSAFSIKTTDNDIWVATMGQGLLRINAATSEVKAYKMKAKATTDRKIDCLANDFLSGLSVSSDKKRIYAATTMGVCCLDIEKDSWVNVFGKNCINYGTPTRVAKEFDGKLWIGTNDGLFCYDIQKKTMQNYTTEKGLADNGVVSFEQDKEGKLWLGTDHGLSCLNPKTGEIQSFFVDNGLQSNEFSDGASFMVDNGNTAVLLFGGVGGITWFHPERVKQSKWDAKVSIVSFIVNRKPVNSNTKSGSYQVCDTTVFAADRFDLASHDNTFSILFSTLTYGTPDNITYLYSINNEAFTRLQPGANELTITHLPPGTYHFRVKAQRNNQTTEERTFTVVVHAPWYRTPFAYMLYLVALGAAIWYYLANRRRKEKDRLKLQEHIHKEQMGEAKLRFFMNISHEIRTPMTLIITPLLSLMKQDHDPMRTGVYQTIKRNAERILHLINQMMDLRKIDKGMMQMRMRETDLVGFVGELFSLFDHQATVKNISFKYTHDSETLPVWVDRQNFDKVIVNILSNAFKYTPAGGEIYIQVTHDENNARIAIGDNGEKIPEDKLNKIFERFYQSPSEINDRSVGTGIGLDLTRSLVELHHGSIEAHNLTQGCEFVVTIPLGKDHLLPEEIAQGEEDTTSALMEGLETETHDAVEPVPETEVKTAFNKRYSIVIAEDDDEIRDYIVNELSRDYDVRACINGRDALSEIYLSQPDLVISDVMMPEMDGNQLCTQLKLNPQTNHIPFILLTAKNRDEDKLEGLDTGADSYIVKPFNMDILRRTIANLISARRILRQKYGQTERLEKKVEDVKLKSPDEKLLERVMKTINKHLNNSDLSVDMIAEEVGISRVHLHRKMKELTGQTPHDFIRQLRLKQAAHLLANNNMNITEVVYACGFSNAASFSTMFKSVYGMSPREYMKEHKK